MVWLYPVPSSLLINRSKAATKLLLPFWQETQPRCEWVPGKNQDLEQCGHGNFPSFSPSPIPISVNLCPSSDFLRQLGLELPCPLHRWNKQLLTWERLRIQVLPDPQISPLSPCQPDLDPSWESRKFFQSIFSGLCGKRLSRQINWAISEAFSKP